MVYFRALLSLFATVAIAGVSALPSNTGGILPRSADDTTVRFLIRLELLAQSSGSSALPPGANAEE